MKTLKELQDSLPVSSRPAGSGLTPFIDAGVTELYQLTPAVLQATPRVGPTNLRTLVMALACELDRVHRQAIYADESLDEAHKHLAMIARSRA
jgi:hypothetical protein